MQLWDDASFIYFLINAILSNDLVHILTKYWESVAWIMYTLVVDNSILCFN